MIIMDDYEKFVERMGSFEMDFPDFNDTEIQHSEPIELGEAAVMSVLERITNDT